MRPAYDGRHISCKRSITGRVAVLNVWMEVSAILGLVDIRSRTRGWVACARCMFQLGKYQVILAAKPSFNAKLSTESVFSPFGSIVHSSGLKINSDALWLEPRTRMLRLSQGPSIPHSRVRNSDTKRSQSPAALCHISHQQDLQHGSFKTFQGSNALCETPIDRYARQVQTVMDNLRAILLRF